MARPLFLSLPPRVECFQRVHLAVPPNYLPAPAFDKLSPIRLRQVQANEANILRLLATRQEIVWNML